MSAIISDPRDFVTHLPSASDPIPSITGIAISDRGDALHTFTLQDDAPCFYLNTCYCEENKKATKNCGDRGVRELPRIDSKM